MSLVSVRGVMRSTGESENFRETNVPLAYRDSILSETSAKIYYYIGCNSAYKIPLPQATSPYPTEHLQKN